MQTQMKACQQPLSMVRARLPLSPAQTHAQRHAPHTRAALNPHPPRSRARNVDLLDADLGRPALEVLTRLCDQGGVPSASPYETAAPRTARSQVNPTALAAVVRGYGRNGTRRGGVAGGEESA